MPSQLDEVTLVELLDRYRDDGDEDALDLAAAQLYAWGLREVTKLARRDDCDWAEAQSRFGEQFTKAIKGYDSIKGQPIPFVSGVVRNAIRESVKARVRDRKLLSFESELPSREDDDRSYHEVADEQSHPNHESGHGSKSEMQAERRALFLIIAVVGGYPHQQIAFGLCTYIVGTWNASQIVAERYGPGFLPTLLETVTRELGDAGFLSEDIELFRNLIADRLGATGREVFGKHYPDLETTVLKDSQLQDYFGTRGGATSIADWSSKLKGRVERFIHDPERSLKRSRPLLTSTHAGAVLEALEDVGR